jgi:hypothetical protein
MKILESILNSLPHEIVPVEKVVIGVHWTVVCSNHCGLSSTMTECGPHGHSRLKDVGHLHKKSAQELAEWIKSDNLLEASVGMAAINSLIDVDMNNSGIESKNAADVLTTLGKGKNVSIIGHFPFVDKIKSIANQCWVIEKRPFGGDHPEESAAEFLPQSDFVAITATAFINHTITKLLSLCRSDAKVMILGPSTPLLPLLFNHWISYISGSRVIDENAAILTIQQGAAFPQVQGVRLITMNSKIKNEFPESLAG